MFTSQPTQLMILVLVVSIANVSAQELSSTLHTTITGVRVAYDGEIVTFTCVTRNSGTMAWTSNDYLSSRVEFTVHDPLGTHTPTSTHRANATFLSIDQSMTGMTILVSQLRIRVVSTFQTSSVTCHSVGTDRTNTATFYVADETTVTCNKLSVCPTEPVTCTCMTGHSMMHSWISDRYTGRGNQLEFTSTDSVGTRRNSTLSNTFAVLVNISNENDVFVITSNVTVEVERSDVLVVLTCVNTDRQNSTVILPIVDDCPGSQTNVVVPGQGTASDTSFIAPLILLIIVIIFLVTLAIIFVLAYVHLTRKLKEKDKQIEDLQAQVAEKKEKIKDLQEQVAEKKEKIKTLQTEIATRDKKIEDLQEQVAEKEKKLRQSEKKLEEKLQFQATEIKRLETQVKEKNREINELLTASVKDNHTIKQLETQVKERNREILQFKAQLREKNPEVGRQLPPAGEGRKDYRGHHYK